MTTTPCARCGKDRLAEHLRDGLCRWGCVCVKCRRRPAGVVSGGGRGLCPTCYRNTHKKVASGRTTWAELEMAGHCLPLLRVGGKATDKQKDALYALLGGRKRHRRPPP